MRTPAVKLNSVLDQLYKDNVLLSAQSDVFIKEELIISDSEQSDSSSDDSTDNIQNEDNINTITPSKEQSHETISTNKIRKKRSSALNVFIWLYCHKCDKKITNKSHLKSTDCIDCGSPAIYQCGNCKKHFDKRKFLYSHLKYHCMKKQSYKCPDCNYKTSRQKYLNHHTRSMHIVVNPKNYSKCEKCDKKYKNKKDLNNHKKLCGVTPNLSCKHCDYVTNNPRLLRLHTTNKHLHINPEDYHKCPHCDMTFKFKRYIVTHIRKRHKKGKTMKCEHCRYKTFLKAKLLNHILNHHHPDEVGED